MTEEGMNKSARNPYQEPIRDLWQGMWGINWTLPFLSQGLQVIVTVVILAILCVLYMTIGFVSQFSTTFARLISEESKKIRGGSPVEGSAHAITAGVYVVVFLPFWIIQSPFDLLGRLWLVSRPFTILLLLVIIAATVLFLMDVIDIDSIKDVF